MRTAVLTDSSAVMPRTWVDGRWLHVIPVEIAWSDGRAEPGDVPYSSMADRLRDGTARTAAPSPGAYTERIAELMEGNDGLVIICPPSDLSTTFASATLAARQLGSDRVRVLDARTAAAGQGLVAAQAARSAADGADLETVVDRALHVASRTHVWATLSQLAFLRRSGRIPAVAAMGAHALRIQPVIRYTKGSPTLVGVVRSSEAGRERIFRAFTRTRNGGALHAVAFHSARHEDAEELCRRLRGLQVEVEAHPAEVSASVATHTGPGLLGLAWFWNGR